MMHRGRTDEEVVAAVVGGDIDAFGALVERYEPRLVRYVRRFVMDAEDAQDIVQEALIKAYTNLRSFDITRRFSPWVYRIAHNEVVNWLKKRKSLPFSVIDFDTFFPQLVAKETAEGPAERDEVRRQLDQALGKLEVKYREPLVLFYFDELDYRAIADILKVPVATIGVRLMRGRAKLRELVAPLR